MSTFKSICLRRHNVQGSAASVGYQRVTLVSWYLDLTNTLQESLTAMPVEAQKCFFVLACEQQNEYALSYYITQGKKQPTRKKND